MSRGPPLNFLIVPKLPSNLSKWLASRFQGGSPLECSTAKRKGSYDPFDFDLDVEENPPAPKAGKM